MNIRDEYRWWQWGIVYQVYPRSFQDSNGDGIGDLNGIAARLDYLKWLGVTAVWISPVYPSPMADFGYDVADYTDIDRIFGTLDDFDRLVAEAHGRGLRVLMDYVPNHTSDRHPWFLESRSSRDNPKRDWYIWREAKPDGSPPNNWLSHFGGRAWEWDEKTGQYYYHAFLTEQPDLNWHNPEVQSAMMDVLRFWLDRGVDGFRVDVMWEVIKDEQLRDNPPNPGYREGHTWPYFEVLPLYSSDQPECHQIVQMMRRVVDEYEDRVLIGEIYLPVQRLVAYYGANGDEAHMPFNFQLLLLAWNARVIAPAIDVYETALPDGAWPNWVLGNHDRQRVASRIGKAQARVAAMLLLTLRGTPTMYQGEELGMEDVPVPPDRLVDPPGKRYPKLNIGRDPERTPMQWDTGPNAGFTTGEPWLPLADDHSKTNVAVQREDAASMLSLYRRLIELRQAEPALMVGSYRPLPAEGDVVAYEREAEGRRPDGRPSGRFLVALNLGAKEAEFALPQGMRGTVELSTHCDRKGETVSGTLSLRGDEGVVVRVTG